MGNQSSSIDAVALEAWAEAAEVGGQHQVCVDLTFKLAVMGDDPESNLTFVLGIKKAELIFVLPSDSNCAVVPNSVVRDGGRENVEVTNEIGSELTKTGKIASRVSIANLAPGAGLASESGFSGRDYDKTKIVEKLPKIKSLHLSDGGQHSWIIRPGVEGQILEGKVWSQENMRRLNVNILAGKSKIEPFCKIEVKCRADDLSITDIKIKRPKFGDFVKLRNKNKEKAVEAFLVNFLHEKGLLEKTIQDKGDKLPPMLTIALFVLGFPIQSGES